jgi:hypothetical protein
VPASANCAKKEAKKGGKASMKPQLTRTRQHMVSRDVGWCATQHMRCERMEFSVGSHKDPYCCDSRELLVRIGNCVRLGKQCQIEHDTSRLPAIVTPTKSIQDTRKRTASAIQKATKALSLGRRKQVPVSGESLGTLSHCKSRYERCEWLLGRGKFRCEWLGDDLVRDEYGPLRPQECLDEPADEKKEEK